MQNADSVKLLTTQTPLSTLSLNTRKKSLRNRFCLFIWGPSRVFKAKSGWHSRDTDTVRLHRWNEMAHVGNFCKISLTLPFLLRSSSSPSPPSPLLSPHPPLPPCHPERISVTLLKDWWFPVEMILAHVTVHPPSPRRKNNQHKKLILAHVTVHPPHPGSWGGKTKFVAIKRYLLL